MAIEFVFSVPTTWYGQDILNDFNAIIRKAGFGVPHQHEAILGLTEAGAAAVASTNQVGSSIPFNNGDVFLSIDAGGGTTDLAFVKILSTNPPTMEQVQDVRGTGIGSMLIDTSFQQLVSEKLRIETNSRDQLPEDLPLQLVQSSYYKGQKHRFGDSLYDLNVEAYRTPFPASITGSAAKTWASRAGICLFQSMSSIRLSLNQSVIHLTNHTRKELARIFDVQIEKILELLREALDRFEKDGYKYVASQHHSFHLFRTSN